MDKDFTNYLNWLVVTPFFPTDRARINYIKNYLLFTVLGFLWTPEETYVFGCGDGTLLVNDEVTYIDVGTTPHYAAYQLIPKNVPEGFAERSHLTVQRFENVQRIGIGSDAFAQEEALVPGLWNQANLQLHINKLSMFDHHFRDDVSVILLEDIDARPGTE